MTGDEDIVERCKDFPVRENALHAEMVSIAEAVINLPVDTMHLPLSTRALTPSICRAIYEHGVANRVSWFVEHGVVFVIGSVDLEKWWWAQIAKKESAGPPSHNLRVDLAGKSLTLDGTTYDVTSERALRWVKILADHADEWVSSSDLECHDPDLMTKRPDRLRKYLPAEVLALITSQTGAGSILRLRK